MSGRIRQIEQKTISELLKVAAPHELIYVMFSGGKDSLVVLDLARRVARIQGHQLKALHIDTTVAIPTNLKYVRSVCRRFSVEFEILRPSRSFAELTVRKGFPTFRARWCCDYLKLRPVRTYFGNIRVSRLVLDGLRAEESARRMNAPKLEWSQLYGCLSFRPILDWTGEEVSAYISRHRLPSNPLYFKGFRRAADCWCGLYKSREDFVKLKKHFPSFFEKLLELESAMRKGGSFAFEHGRRVYLRDVVYDA